MRTKTPVLILSTVSLGAATTRPTVSLMAVSVFAVGLLLGGCGPAMTRPPVTQQDLLKARTTADEESVAVGRKLLGRLIERTKADYDRYPAGRRKEPPVIDILIISGGGDWGAFGAGFL